MITPPLSMSAMPRLTRAVPVTGAGPSAGDGRAVAAGETGTDTMNLRRPSVGYRTRSELAWARRERGDRDQWPPLPADADVQSRLSTMAQPGVENSYPG